VQIEDPGTRRNWSTTTGTRTCSVGESSFSDQYRNVQDWRKRQREECVQGSASPKSLPWGENLGANNSDFTTYTAWQRM